MLIDLIGISLMREEDFRQLKIYAGRITCTDYRHDQQIPTRWEFILMELTLLFTLLFSNMILSNQIIEENNEKVKEILKMIDIHPLINYFCLALRSFFILSINSIFITSESSSSLSLLSRKIVF